MRKVISRTLPLYGKVRKSTARVRLDGERPIKKKKVSDSAGDRNRCRMCVKLGGESPMRGSDVSDFAD